MGRRPRIHYPGAIYHVMARGVDGRNIYIDDQDRIVFLSILNRVIGDTKSKILAYCLMGNHFHLAIKVNCVRLSSVMQRILTGYSKTFNHRHERTGHLFQARYRSHLCRDDRYLLRLIQYIQMNPVRAGLVGSASNWPWSSRTAVTLPDLDSIEFEPWAKDEPVTAMMRPPLAEELTLDQIGQIVSQSMGIAIGSLRARSKCRRIVEARALLSREAISRAYGVRAIADWLNTSSEVVAYYLRVNSTNLHA